MTKSKSNAKKAEETDIITVKEINLLLQLNKGVLQNKRVSTYLALNSRRNVWENCKLFPGLLAVLCAAFT